jgi:hypothetical protein
MILLILWNTIKKLCTKQQRKIKELKQKLASSIKIYDELGSNFDKLVDYNVEVASKLKKLEASANTPIMASKRSLFDLIQEGVSTSCIDFIDMDSPMCIKSRVESFIVDSCTDDVVMENDVLKKELDRLTKDLIKLKGKKEEVQCHQDI